MCQFNKNAVVDIGFNKRSPTNDSTAAKPDW